MRLPPSLATQAPVSMHSLKVEGSGVTGALPEEWGQWSSLSTLSLRDNSIVGTLPALWKGMSSLQYLDLQGNPGLRGTIPAEWSALRAQILLSGTGVTGCIPDQLFTLVSGDQLLSRPCSQDSPEVGALIELGRLVDPAGQVLASWDAKNSGWAQQPGQQIGILTAS